MPCGQVKISAAYPNPVQNGEGSVKFDLLSSCPQKVTWRVFTSSYRKVYAETMEVNGPRTAVWDLKDEKGRLVASGLYVIRVQSDGNEPVYRKVLLLY
jgi:hypothetical protein